MDSMRIYINKTSCHPKLPMPLAKKDSVRFFWIVLDCLSFSGIPNQQVSTGVNGRSCQRTAGCDMMSQCRRVWPER